MDQRTPQLERIVVGNHCALDTMAAGVDFREHPPLCGTSKLRNAALPTGEGRGRGVTT